ncbi:MAG TPA: hypothetical protein VIF60_16035 [Burkholderiaceae bacterium]|jgi:TPR repeat protein
MQLSFNKRSRTALLIGCLALIGGSACVNAPRLSSEQQLAAQQKFAEQNRLEAETLQHEAAGGNMDALVKLGNMTILGNRPGVTRDIPKGMAMLEKGAGASYAPAQYALGRWLIDGRVSSFGLQLDAALMPRDPLRGINLLKQAASQTCTPGPVSASAHIAAEISIMYRTGKQVAHDDAQAELWLARSLIHCHYPNAPYLAASLNDPLHVSLPLQIDTLTKLMLLPASDTQATLQAALRPEDIQAARDKAQVLREAVRESEKQYPAPNPSSRK